MRRNINIEVSKKGRGREAEKRVWVIGKNSELFLWPICSYLPASAAWLDNMVWQFIHLPVQLFGIYGAPRLETWHCAILIILISTLVSLTSLSFYLKCLATPNSWVKKLSWQERATQVKAQEHESAFSTQAAQSVHLRSKAPGGRDGDSGSRRKNSLG